MTAPPAASPAAPAHRDPAVHTATPGQLHWLEGELRAWQAEGLVDEATTLAIRRRYVANRRFTLSRIVLTLGASFVALGLVWLVAACRAPDGSYWALQRWQRLLPMRGIAPFLVLRERQDGSQRDDAAHPGPGEDERAGEGVPLPLEPLGQEHSHENPQGPDEHQ